MREGSGSRSGWLGIPASALTALPACPACYPAYAGILGALGLGGLANVPGQAAITALLLAAALAALAYRGRSRRGFGPFSLGTAASAVVVVSKFVLGWDAGTYVGVALLVAAGVWNVWPAGSGNRENRADALEASDAGR